MFGLLNRGSFVDPAVEVEFEHLINRLKAIWLAEHNEDGTHLAPTDASSVVPVGSIVAWPSATIPAGWLVCNGGQISRLKYSTLFTTIGTTYGTGDGSTTFNLPDLRQKFVLGLAASGTGSTLGGSGGAIDHTHGAGSYALDAHTHSIDPPNTTSTSTDISHTHTFSATTGTPSATTDVLTGTTAVASDTHTHSVSGTTDSDGGSHTHDVDIPSFTSGSASANFSGVSGTNNPPFVAMPYIVYTGVLA